jgi:hypothetical protein
LDAVIADLDTRIQTLEQAIAVVLHEQAWAESTILLQTMHSSGPLTTAWLLVGTLNFRGCPTPAAAVAYVGVTPCYGSPAAVCAGDHRSDTVGTSGCGPPCTSQPSTRCASIP